nr:DUF1329 domain-containing protein [Oceanococcus sp. HetDA_MAG_MS8]
MNTERLLVAMGLMAGMMLPQAGIGKVPAEEAAKLGNELTPVGAERAGNAEGTIPAWTPAPQSGELNAFPGDPELEAQQPIFTISAKNVDDYAAKLTEGHKELMRRFPDSYKMNVYPSVRKTNFPQKILDETIKNATRAELEGVDNPRGAYVGFPFPIPKSGAEPIWNHRTKWRGNALIRPNDQMIVQQDGSFKVTKIIEDVKFYYANIEEENPPELKPGVDFLRYLSETVAPPRIAGTFILVHEKAGFGPEGRSAWLYAPALKRIRRAPAVCCDNPYEGTDGHQFYDQVDMYNGVLERFSWKMIGKREMYIPANSYKIGTPPTTYDEIASPNHVNQDLPRYELRRVWVVEANNKPDNRHTFSKRTIYLDEDSWNVVAIDAYDHEGKLMQFQEGHLMDNTNIQATSTQPEIIYHLNSGRYFATAMQNEGRPYDQTVSFSDRHFEPNTVQKQASK